MLPTAPIEDTSNRRHAASVSLGCFSDGFDSYTHVVCAIASIRPFVIQDTTDKSDIVISKFSQVMVLPPWLPQPINFILHIILMRAENKMGRVAIRFNIIGMSDHKSVWNRTIEKHKRSNMCFIRFTLCPHTPVPAIKTGTSPEPQTIISRRIFRHHKFKRFEQRSSVRGIDTGKRITVKLESPVMRPAVPEPHGFLGAVLDNASVIGLLHLRELSTSSVKRQEPSFKTGKRE